jgi:hypothetical protein
MLCLMGKLQNHSAKFQEAQLHLGVKHLLVGGATSFPLCGPGLLSPPIHSHQVCQPALVISYVLQEVFPMCSQSD